MVSWSGANDVTLASSQTLITAVNGVLDNNIVLVQAAGNQSGAWGSQNVYDSCEWSFGGRVPGVIVAGGVDFSDGRWVRRSDDSDDVRYINAGDRGSNVGSCIDIWAPSAHVIASNMNGNDLACRLSGTSMAAPHVAGVVALYLQSNPAATPAQVKAALRSRGTWGALQSSSGSGNFIGDDSDNVLVYSDTRSTGDTAPVASFSVTCPGRQCSFNAGGSTDDVQIVSYSWKFGDGSTGSGGTLKHTYPANFTGFAVLTVTDNTGKTDHFRQPISVNADAPPAAVFTVSCTGLACAFDSNGSSDDAGISSRSWDFGDGNTGSGTVVNHTYAALGAYTVVLTVTDTAGQTATQSKPIAPGLLPPAGVTADGSGAMVTIHWTPSTGAGGYNIERKTSSAAWQPAGSVSGGSTSIGFDVPPSSSNGIVLYRVFAYVGSATSFASSNNDAAFVGTFSDDPLATSSPFSLVKAEHITQLRAAVNGLMRIGEQADVYLASDLDPANLRDHAVDDGEFTSLMTNLNIARTLPKVGLPATAFRAPAPTGNGAISRTNLEDLRLGVK